MRGYFIVKLFRNMKSKNTILTATLFYPYNLRGRNGGSVALYVKSNIQYVLTKSNIQYVLITDIKTNI